MKDSNKKEIEELRKEVSRLYEYISGLPHYEYYVDEVNIKKVKGNVQLGQLIQNGKEDNQEGVHKIIVDKVNIDEVSEKGVVGVGVTEKKKTKKKKKKISPEKAPKEIKEIYKEI